MLPVIVGVVPLAVRVLIERIDQSVDQRNKCGQSVCRREIRNRDKDSSTAALGFMRRQRSDDAATPVVSDPNGRLTAEVIMELGHICHDLLVGVCAGVSGGG